MYISDYQQQTFNFQLSTYTTTYSLLLPMRNLPPQMPSPDEM